MILYWHDGQQGSFKVIRQTDLFGLALQQPGAFYDLWEPASLFQVYCDIEEIPQPIAQRVEATGSCVEYGLPGQPALYYTEAQAPSRVQWALAVLNGVGQAKLFKTEQQAAQFAHGHEPAQQAWQFYQTTQR
ncbi:hypothetical protein [Magnetococcus sp. PR-3]|uniref:hypothetical protein n=1 Tax=Magnetococcus sp. PR-3 TaxID=3120355 RepID=UPI002FCE0A98